LQASPVGAHLVFLQCADELACTLQVYFLPVAADMWDGGADVPGHPALSAVADSEQYLTSRYRCS